MEYYKMVIMTIIVRLIAVSQILLPFLSIVPIFSGTEIKKYTWGRNYTSFRAGLLLANLRDKIEDLHEIRKGN